MGEAQHLGYSVNEEQAPKLDPLLQVLCPAHLAGPGARVAPAASRRHPCLEALLLGPAAPDPGLPPGLHCCPRFHAMAARPRLPGLRCCPRCHAMAASGSGTSSPSRTQTSGLRCYPHCHATAASGSGSSSPIRTHSTSCIRIHPLIRADPPEAIAAHEDELAGGEGPQVVRHLPQPGADQGGALGHVCCRAARLGEQVPALRGGPWGGGGHWLSRGKGGGTRQPCGRGARDGWSRAS